MKINVEFDNLTEAQAIALEEYFAVWMFLKEKKIEVDQCLVEQIGKKNWIHLSIKKEGNRNQFARLINGNFSLIDSQDSEK